MILIDGEYVEDEQLSPDKHRFIGMFRRPYTLPKSPGFILCKCGQVLKSTEEGFNHWQSGHWDYPQYVSIGKEVAAS